MPISHLPRRTAIILIAATYGLFAISPAMAQQQPEDAVIGAWEADDGSVKLDLFKSGSEFQAHLLYGNEVMEADNITFKQDGKNPDPALRTRSLENIVFITGLRWEDGEWSGGSLYDGSSGSTYHCTIKLDGSKMLLRGYLGISLLGQTRAFHRVVG
jgi:uncharacterized protein (DUF2147 family)